MNTSSIGGTYGLSGSGLDVDSIVKKLMTAQQTKQDTIYQKKTIAEWQKKAYNKIYDDISKFRTTVFNYKLQQTLRPNKVTSSNSSVVTATANADAPNINHSLVVNTLASGVNLISSKTIADSTNSTDKTSIATQFGISATSPFTITIGDGSATASITIDPSQSINQVVSDINSAGLKLQANYDSRLDRFFLSTTNTGKSAQVTLSSTGTGDSTTDPGLDFIQKLNLFGTKTPTTVNNADSTITTTYASDSGTDASFILDGIALTEDSNTFTISGVTYNLTGVSSSDTSPTYISVSADMDTAVSNVKTLVDAYNEILSELNTLLNEKRYSDYPPLTDAQKKEMKDKEIELWNEKAQSGMLRRDSTLTNLVNSMRNAFSSAVSGIVGKYNSASSIGITTSSDYTEGGKLYLDTDKLTAALKTDPNALGQLFGASGTTNDTNSQGIAGRLYDLTKNAMDQLKSIAGANSVSHDSSSFLAKKINDYTNQMSKAQDTYLTMQDRYYKQFNALEVALQNLSSQGNWLFSMFNKQG